MKFSVIFLCIIVMSCSAPPPRKLFHEHLEDFVGLIIAEKGPELEVLIKQYAENKEFCMALTYFRTTNFKDMFYEIYSLPEFQDMINFLEKDNIDIHYIIDSVKEIIDQNDNTKKHRHQVDEKQLNSFIRDSVNLLPKEKLAILLEEKKQEDGVFKTAVENLHSKKWNRVYSALWDSDMFQKEVCALEENGINMKIILQQLSTVFGDSLLPKLATYPKTLVSSKDNI